VLINITGGYDMTLFELDEAANKIREMVDEEANIIVGSTLDPEMGGKMRVSVVATGIDAAGSRESPPMPRRAQMAAPAQPARMEAPRNFAPAPRQPEPQPVAARLEEPEEPAYDPRAFEPAEEEPADGLPAPAYRPAPAPAEAPAPMAATRAPAPGTPTPEALERLRAMASRAAAARAAEPRATGGAPAASGVADKPRFGINSLLNRMTGTAEGAGPSGAAAPPAPGAPRPAPPLRAAETEAEAERSDIPAFLRRQAN
jgi:cell division protein FtsZ